MRHLFFFPLRLSCAFFAVALFILRPAYAQEFETPPEGRCAGIMFYNVENLFDAVNDSLTNDDDFTYEGLRRWSYGRMLDKFRKIYRVILNAGEWNPPVLVGLCEVENLWVLNLMLDETGLRNLGYRVVHYDSPDERGIDVALLYQHDRFRVVASESIPIDFGPGERPTRDVLYVKGVMDGLDTLHVLVNHWTSRYGGSAATQWKRALAAQRVKIITDALYAQNAQSLILVMGDFNEPHRSGLFPEHLESGSLEEDVWLVSPALCLPPEAGTIKYQHQWQVYDQIMVSRSFLEGDSPIYIEKPEMRILNFPFLMEVDDQFGGEKPFRTYTGMRYHGGFSDHLPVWIDLKTRGGVGENVLADPFEEHESGSLGNIE